MYPNLKLEIFKRGIHQNHLAKELGIKEANLSKIIHGYREPSETMRKLISDYFAVDEAWLFEEYNGNAAVNPAAGANVPLEQLKDGGS
jgi:transcriptional regulator with XRE-family HTH domain